MVIAISSAYWLGSQFKLPEASWAEIAMYRLRGDNQVYPTITALSRLNLGDPTDSLKYGEGTAASQAVILIPYALAYALFGVPGYLIADVALAWVYFLVITMLLRRCRFSDFSSLLIGSALGSRSLQILCEKISESLNALLSVSHLQGTWEWGFPNLLDIQIFVQRIPRPMVTAIFVVLLLYFLVRQWTERQQPTFRRGLAIGALMAILLQGDPFSLAALGLLLLWVMGWTLAANGWRIPWRFAGGTALGTLIFGAYFIWQRLHEHPDYAARFGVFDHPRSEILFLPGYGPLLRVGVICCLAGLVILAARRFSKSEPDGSSSAVAENKKISRKEKPAAKSAVEPDEPFAFHASQSDVTVIKSVAFFCMAMMVAAWLAQPIQLLLLGKGCQIYHYLLFIVPSFYSYAFVILVFSFLKLATSPELPRLIQKLGQRPHWMGGTLLGLLILMETLVGTENKLGAASTLTNSRQETNVPWAQAGELYRPSFRELEKQFQTNPELKQVKSFATFCYEVNFLLAAFYDKRAFLPDNAYSTLSDKELEERLFETVKILQLPPDHFLNFAQVNFILNYWLGCAKYWFTSDHQYSTRNDYTDQQWSELQQQAKQTPWMLCLPISECQRLINRYAEVFNRPSDRSQHPDALIVGLEKGIGMTPNPNWYREVYTNQLFSIYVKIPGS